MTTKNMTTKTYIDYPKYKVGYADTVYENGFENGFDAAKYGHSQSFMRLESDEIIFLNKKTKKYGLVTEDRMKFYGEQYCIGWDESKQNWGYKVGDKVYVGGEPGKRNSPKHAGRKGYFYSISADLMIIKDDKTEELFSVPIEYVGVRLS